MAATAVPFRDKEHGDVVEAVQVDTSDYDQLCDLVVWCGGHAVDEGDYVIAIDSEVVSMRAKRRDWIVRMSDGQFTVYDPTQFLALFVPN